MTWNCCGGPRSPFPEGPSRPEVQTSDKKAIKYNKRRLKWSLKENNGRLFLEGLALVADIPTVNRRIYTREILGPALKRYWFTKQKTRSENWVAGRSGKPNDGCPSGTPFCFGELEHPSYSNRRRYCTVSPHTASHEVVGLRWEGRSVHVVVEVLRETSAGRSVIERLKSGQLIGISIRTWASLGELDDSSGLKVVMDDLDVLTFDLVMEPSVKGAVMRPVTSVVMLPDEYKEHDKLGYHDPDNDPMGRLYITPKKGRAPLPTPGRAA